MKDEGGRMKGSSGWLVGVAAVAVIAACGASISGLDSVVHPPEAPAGLDAHETHASASLLGQFRSSASAWLWVRTDLYLHNGVEMRPMTESEKREGTENHGAAEDDHLMDESAIVTLVPSKQNDFRGTFGDIERATSAYQDMRGHQHNDPTQALPLLRLMTWIDPKFIIGWTVGSAVIARDRSDKGTGMALAYLREGLKENSRNIAIRSQIGELLASRSKDFEGAVKILEEARDVAFNARDLAEDEKESLRIAYRWLGLSYRQLGNHEMLKNRMAEGLRVFPDDLVLARLFSPPPLSLTKKGEAEWLEHVLEEANHKHGPGCGHEDY